MRQKLRYLDYSILIPYLILSTIGVIMVYSASSDILLVNGFSPSVYMKRQIIYFLAAFIAFGIPCFALKLGVFKNRKFVMSYLGISFLMLMFLIVLKIVSHGKAAVNGAVGWIDLASGSSQIISSSLFGFCLVKTRWEVYSGTNLA